MDFHDEQVLGILRISEELNRLRDVDAILDKILYESRRLSKADAGSIFLVEDGVLRFAYVQNDSLFKTKASNAEAYADFTVPIDETSIVGHTALTGQMLSIDDAYELSTDLPYTFNKDFDRRSGYRTRSILTIPIKTFDGDLVGVVQLINALDENGGPVPFSLSALAAVPLLANSAAVTIERGMMGREMILRMVKTAELRDVEETGAHVQRVGAYSAEIYRTWATANGMDKKAVRAGVDTIRLAAMLHDVGKVAVPDAIIKKPASLTKGERDLMEWHTVYGARLFAEANSELDRMSFDIALNHHEKWAGGGYPGKIGDVMSPATVLGVPKRGQEIPLAARIVSLADVFDALSSPRSYKEPWPDAKVLDFISGESGLSFDPELVAAFLDIFEVIKAIRAKYRDLRDRPAGKGQFRPEAARSPDV